VLHNGVTVSLHPAGHVLGSAQVRMEYRGEVWVASGDYKIEPDSTCAGFEPVRCDTFITESTFGLPIYRWQPQQEVYDEINAWWRANAEAGRASIMQCYSFGKAQRILSGLDPDIGPIICHGAVQTLNQVYRDEGVYLPPTVMVQDVAKSDIGASMVIAPPSAAGSPWVKRFGDFSDAFASGWMQLRGARRRRGVDRGFVLSDHADWPGLMQAISATGAQRVIVTHGSIPVLVRWLQQQGLQASGFDTEYGDDEAAEPGDADVASVAAAGAEANASAVNAADAGAKANASARASAANAAAADANANAANVSADGGSPGAEHA
jgi:putative mRNA 3-end processing factor